MTDLFDSEEDWERVQVMPRIALDAPYDYKAALSLSLKRGDVVEIPLGNRTVPGVVWEICPGDQPSDVPESRLRDVVRKYPLPPIPESVLDLVSWVSGYTVSPLGATLRMATSVPAAFEAPSNITAYTRLPPDVEPPDLRLTPARRRVLDLLADGPPRLANEVALEAGVGTNVIKGLANAGAIESVELPRDAPPPVPDPAVQGPELSKDQQAAADQICGHVDAEEFAVTLLDGVTGSGKTEVYFEAIAAALKQGRQALVLLPEIALSAQWLARFEARFGVLPVEWHSDLPTRQRRAIWRATAFGQVKVMVGARSALFLPFDNLGVIIVDEEHEQAYKQEDGVAYHARDMAVVRAHIENIPVVLASATPSLESVENANRGRYEVAHLKARHGGALMPEVQLVDLRRDKPERGRWLSPPLVSALHETLKAGEQSLLFLNRRGYAPLTLCRTCGHRMECPNCTAWLIEHRLFGNLQCHHCGLSAPKPLKCPSCVSEDSFVASGPGVERLAEEVLERFPEARFQIASSDTLTGPAAAAEFVRSMQDGEVDIIIGTQIVAKGHHFPLLTLVGVVDADLGLVGGDLRASERTFQLLHQVAGRAGREERPGRVMLQTHEPDAPVMQALVEGDREGFMRQEAAARKAAGMPPFGRLVAIIVSGPDATAADDAARQIGRAAPNAKDVLVLGPAPAPLTLLRGRHRRRLLVKTTRTLNVQKLMHDWIGPLKFPNAVRVSVDVDPYSFL